MNSKERKNGNRMINIKKVFEELRDKITSQPILTLLKREGNLRVETNISGHTIERVLFQK